MGSQRVRLDLANEQQQQQNEFPLNLLYENALNNTGHLGKCPHIFQPKPVTSALLIVQDIDRQVFESHLGQLCKLLNIPKSQFSFPLCKETQNRISIAKRTF